MARATRKGGMCGKKHYGGRKHAATRRTKHKHTKTCKHARRGAKKSGHKKRKHTRRGRKHGGSLKSTLRTQMAERYGSPEIKTNFLTGTVSGQGKRSGVHDGREVERGVTDIADKISSGATSIGDKISNKISSVFHL
jgi:hypothetical protein